MNGHLFVAALVCAATLASCDAYEKNRVQRIDGPVPAGAQVKFFNFGLNTTGVNFYADARKVTAIISATGVEDTLGVRYGNAAAGGFYAVVDAGSPTITGRLAGTVDKGLAIATLPTTLQDGKHYTFYQSGVYNTGAKTIESFIVEDNFVPEYDYSVAYVRFVNAISNASPMILYATKAAPPDSGSVDTLGAAVAYKAAGAFLTVVPGLYNLSTRYADSTANKISRTGVSFARGRIYTITARGDITLSSGTNVRFLDNTANR